MTKSESTTLLDYTNNAPTTNQQNTVPDTVQENRSTGTGKTPDPDPGNDPDNTETNPNDDSICPCYTEELAKSREALSEELFNHLQIVEIKCGHAIDYLTTEVGVSLARKTARGYSSYLRCFIESIHENGKTVCEVDFREVEEFIKDLVRLNRAESTLLGYRSLLTNLYKHIALRRQSEASFEWYYIREEINISDYRTPPARTRTPLTKEEVKKLYAELETIRDKLIVQIGVELGPRNVDIRSLRTEDVDLDERTITIQNKKAGGNYELPLSPSLTLLLRRWIQTERPAQGGADKGDILFPNPAGEMLNAHTLIKIVKEAAEKAGIQESEQSNTPLSPRQKEILNTDKDYKTYYKVTPHTLRHTFNSLMRQAGVPGEFRTKAMDHKSGEVRKKYYEHGDDDYKEWARLEA